MIKLQNWNTKTSFLHFGLAITVTFQLLFAFLMKNGYPRTFILHEIDGLIIVLIVLIHWSFSIRSNNYNLNHLFPWSKKGLSAIISDCNALVMQGQLPQGGPRLGLPGFIHGLGLLAVTWMALTGLLIFTSIQLHLSWRFPVTLHLLMADFVWIYWVGHTIMSFAHVCSTAFSDSSS